MSMRLDMRNILLIFGLFPVLAVAQSIQVNSVKISVPKGITSSVMVMHDEALAHQVSGAEADCLTAQVQIINAALKNKDFVNLMRAHDVKKIELTLEGMFGSTASSGMRSGVLYVGMGFVPAYEGQDAVCNTRTFEDLEVAVQGSERR
jgi:hypothetical protein